MNKKDISESVRQRLLNRAKSENRSFNELLQYYAMEKFLYRLSVSEYVDNFILKGAFIPGEIAAFSKEFIDSKQTMWQAFTKRIKLQNTPDKFAEIVSEVETFLKPAIKIARKIIETKSVSR